MRCKIETAYLIDTALCSDSDTVSFLMTYLFDYKW